MLRALCVGGYGGDRGDQQGRCCDAHASSAHATIDVSLSKRGAGGARRGGPPARVATGEGLGYDLAVGKRRLTATLWIAGAGLPAMAGAALLIGCCVLPFHGVMHRLMPLCEVAANLVAGHHADDGHHDRHPAEPAGKPDKDGGAPQRIAAQTYARGIVQAALPPAGLNAFASATRYRSQISLGAMRCDDDVGQHLALLDTLRL